MEKIKRGILIAFGELFLKSERVRNLFLQKLTSNISVFLKKAGVNFKIFPSRERIFIETGEIKKAEKIIKNVFGISWFADVIFLEGNLEELLKFIEENHEKWVKKRQTFAIRLKKGNLKESSEEIIRKVASKIERKVDLEKPNVELFLEARKDGWFIYFKKKEGKGGLPVGSGGKALALISGGIDSPVASYLIAKRGSENVWVHFHSFPLVSNSSIQKVKELAQVFLRYQPKLKVYFIPFHKIQMKIKACVEPRYRILLYRRMMLRIAEKVAEKEGCDGIVTGESLAQVSSQTLKNLRIIEEVTKLPILRPLVGLDKQEIIELAKKIGTFEISIKPQEDCCTLFTPKHASAAGNLELVRSFEKRLNIEKMIEEVLENVEIKSY
ncbi:MAG: tRNA uracil 4-sulfurtransferase ThiI [Candidatus Aenigmatarchaeota archaeon]